MYKFSERSKYNLSTAHVDLQTLFNFVIRFTDCSVIWGYRGEDAQNRCYQEGTSSLLFPYSKHNQTPSLAVDVVPHPSQWDNEQALIKFGELVLAIAYLLKKDEKLENYIVWGGTWSKPDFAHFQI